MKTRARLLVALATLALSAGVANAAGCIEGAAVGGVAGHVADHHAVAGAAIGCAVGHHKAKVKAKKEAAQANAAVTSNSPTAVPDSSAVPTKK
jgi:hypothetical protein